MKYAHISDAVDKAVAEEREACAKIADEESAEYRRLLVEYNREHRQDDVGVSFYAKMSEADNIAALIRQGYRAAEKEAQ